MEVLGVTLLVYVVLFTSYVYFDKKARKQKEEVARKNTLISAFYRQEMNCMKKLELVGDKSDELNSEFEFKRAVEKINMSSSIRVQLYN